MPLSLVAFALALLAAPSMGLLLVVGDVDADAAVVLFECLGERECGGGGTMTATLTGGDGQPVDVTLPLQRGAKVHQFTGLLPDTEYRVAFSGAAVSTDGEQAVTFRTWPADGAPSATQWQVVALSCNRVIADNDTAFFEELADTYPARHATVHFGDQIYGDFLFKRFSDPAAPPHTYEQMVELYRDVYRRVWGDPALQRVLRRGGHYMTPDDHDVFDNFDREMLEGEGATVQLARAALQVMWEYQGALSPAKAASRNWWWARKFGRGVAVIQLDTRYERTLHYDERHPRLGSTQFQWLQQQLAAFHADEAVHTILVVSSVPLLYGSQISALIAWHWSGDRYSGHADHAPHSVNIMRLLKPYKDKVRLLTGDIHQGNVVDVCWDDSVDDGQGAGCVPLAVSSGMSLGSSTVKEWPLWWFASFHRIMPTTLGEFSIVHSPGGVNHTLHNSFQVWDFDDASFRWHAHWRGVEGMPEPIPTLNSWFERFWIAQLLVLGSISAIFSVPLLFLLCLYYTFPAHRRPAGHQKSA